MFIKEFPIWNAFSVQSFWLALMPSLPKLALILYGICTLVGIGFFLLFWKKYRENQPVIFAGAVIWLVWSVPYIMVYDWTLLLIPAILIWTHLGTIKPAWKGVLALLWVAGLFSSAFTYLQLQVFPIALQIAIPVLLIGIVLTYHLLSKSSKAHIESS